MSTRLLILAVTLNAVIGQLVLKRGLALMGGPINTTGLLKFILEAVKSPWIYASVFIQGFGYLPVDDRHLTGQTGSLPRQAPAQVFICWQRWLPGRFTAKPSTPCNGWVLDS